MKQIIDLWYQNGYNVFPRNEMTPKWVALCHAQIEIWVQVNQVIRKEAIHLDRLTLKRFAM